MAIIDAQKLFSELDQLGLTVVRVRLAQGVFSEPKAKLVNEWIHQQEEAAEAAKKNRVDRYLDWLRNRRGIAVVVVLVIVVIGVGAFVDALDKICKATPWACDIFCAAPTFEHSTGRFVKVGEKWNEYNAEGTATGLQHTETSRDSQYVYLADRNRYNGDPENYVITRLPIAGG